MSRRTFFNRCLFWTPLLALLVAGQACRSQPDYPDISLSPGVPVIHTFNQRTCAEYAVVATVGQYFRGRASTQRMDLTLTILDSGRKQTELFIPENQTKSFSLLAEQPSTFRLRLCAAEQRTVTGQFTLLLEPGRPLLTSDKLLRSGEQAFARGEILRQEERADSNRLALEQFKSATTQFLAAGRFDQAANSLRQTAELYQRAGQLRLALCFFDEALSLAASAPDEERQSEILSQSSLVQTQLAEYPLAIEAAAKALRLSQNSCHLTKEAQALNALGEAAYGQGNRWEARAYHRRALELWQRLQDRRGLAQSLLYAGYVASDLGNMEEAGQMYEHALHNWQAVGNQRGVALTQAAQAVLRTIEGKAEDALSLLDQALPVIRVAGDRYWEAALIQHIGGLYLLYFSEPDKALRCFEQALAIWKSLDCRTEEAGTLVNIGLTWQKKENPEKALECLREALPVTELLSDQKYEAYALQVIGDIYGSMNKPQETIAAYQQALRLHQATGSGKGMAEVLNQLGRKFLLIADYPTALRQFQQSLSISRKRGDLLAEAETLYEMAALEKSRKRFDQAAVYLEKALDNAELLRSGIASQMLRSSYFAAVQKYFDFQIDLLMTADAQSSDLSRTARALESCERARARSLLDLLAEASAKIRAGADPALLEKEEQLRNQLGRLITLREQLLLGNAPQKKVDQLSGQIESLRIELDRVEAAFRTRSPRYASLIAPSPLSLADIQRQLTEEVLLLEFSLGEKRSFVFAVTKNGLRSYQLPDRHNLASLALRYYDLTRPGENSSLADHRTETERQQLAEKLSNLLLRPLTDDPGKKRLIIVADGALQYLPFAALPLPQGHPQSTASTTTASEALLNQHHEISYLPSASVLATLREDRQKRQSAVKAVAIFADAAFTQNDKRVMQLRARNAVPQNQTTAELELDLSRLRATQREVALLRQLVSNPSDLLALEGLQASRQRAMSDELSQYRIVHFGTHGLINRAQPELSAIVLSMFDDKGIGTDGRLRLGDVYNLRLNAELVVLSACDTALGKEIRGEGLIGLTRGFMYAGASRVLASLWKVDDDATSQFMRYFYESLLRDHLNPAQALSNAQRQMMQHPRYNHPRYWAAFVLQGE